MGQQSQYFHAFGRLMVSLALAILSVSFGFLGVEPSYAATPSPTPYDPICDTHNQKPVRKLSHTVPVPGKAKAAVLCFYNTPLDTNVTTVVSHQISHPARFARLLNQSKPGSYVQCMMYFPYHFTVIFSLTDGHRVYLNPVNCGPLLSNASDQAFQMSAAARARLTQLTAPYLNNVQGNM